MVWVVCVSELVDLSGNGNDGTLGNSTSGTDPSWTGSGKHNGVFEFDAFARGTMSVAHTLAECPARSIIGGGDSVAAVKKAGVESRMTHISTGGGASLEFLEGKTLPGVAALTDA